MKNTKNLKKGLKISAVTAAFALTAAFASCTVPSYPSDSSVVPGQNMSKEFTDYSGYNISAADVSKDFMRGVDASEVAALEELGLKFYDEDNSEKDVFAILAEHGVNWIRLRIWNDYTQELDTTEWGPYGYNNLSRTLTMAKRAKKYGMKVLLDFHYSDTWADPGHQKCPAEWSQITTSDELAQAVGEYTKQILTSMKEDGVAPDMVQLGNEMQGGLFQTNSAVENAKNYTADYLKAGAEAVRSVLPECKIMLHMSNGGKSSYATTLLNYAEAVGSDSEGNAYITHLGVSYYPFYEAHGTDVQLKANLQTFKNAGYNVVIAENSFCYDNDAYTDSTGNTYYQSSKVDNSTYACGKQCAKNLIGYKKGEGISSSGEIDSSIENQAGVMQYLMELCSSVDSAGGYFYWGGCYLGIDDDMKSSWENQALFDSNAKALPSLNAFNVQ